MAKKNEVAVLTPEAADKKVTTLQKTVTALVIKDQTSYENASNLLIMIKSGMTQVMEAFDPQREAAYASYQIALNQLNKYKNPFILAEKQTKEKMGLYLTQQEEKRQLEEQLLQEEEEKRVEAERQKLLKKASRTKNVDKAEDLKDEAEALFAHAPQIASTVSNIGGVQTRFTNKVEVIDSMKLIKAIADGTIRVDTDKLISFKASVLEQYVNLTGAKSIPGTVIKKVPVISGSTGRK